jgi:hypothetical protein
MSETYEMEKWIWTEADFGIMGWHDSLIHAMAFCPDNFELVFDIDYILKWVHPQPGETYFNFWVSPATLVFENVHELKINTDSYTTELEIHDLDRKITSPCINEHTGRETYCSWTIECQGGDIKFNANGYKQYFRTNPVFGGQRLPRNLSDISFVRGRTD